MTDREYLLLVQAGANTVLHERPATAGDERHEVRAEDRHGGRRAARGGTCLAAGPAGWTGSSDVVRTTLMLTPAGGPAGDPDQHDQLRPDHHHAVDGPPRLRDARNAAQPGADQPGAVPDRLHDGRRR